MEEIDPVHCIVLPDDVKEKEIGIYLTRAHVKMKTPWAAFNKAGQVFDLSVSGGLEYDEIAKACGLGKTTITRMIAAYKAVRNYFEKNPKDIDKNPGVRVYSYFDEFFKLKLKLKKEGIDPNWIEENLDRFTEWVHNGQFGAGKEVRALVGVLKYEEAYQVLCDGGKMREAMSILSRVDPTLGDEIFRKIDATVKLFDFSHDKMMEIAENPAKLEYLRKTHQKLGIVIDHIKFIQKSEEKQASPP